MAECSHQFNPCRRLMSPPTARRSDLPNVPDRIVNKVFHRMFDQVFSLPAARIAENNEHIFILLVILVSPSLISKTRT
jgi:hypothetical protein